MTITKNREVSEVVAQEFINLVTARHAIEDEIYETIQAYTWEYDDSEAVKIREHWRSLEAKREEAINAIREFCTSIK